MSSFLPSLNEVPATREMIDAFRGYDHTVRPAIDAFCEMTNCTAALYPALSPRAARGYVRKLAKPNGVFARDRLCWVDGTDFCYDGTMRGQVTDGPKRFVAMGAWVLIWPDKARYNTETGVFDSLDRRNVTGDGETVTYTLCRTDGSVYENYTTGDAPPETPADGQLWVDAREMPHVLKQWSALRGMWVSMPTTFVKISAPGIGAGFAEDDGVTLSGCVGEFSALNGDVILYDAGDDFLVVVGVIDQTGTQTEALTIAREAPDMEYVTEYGNRVWGCSSAKHEIYACKLGDPTNWRCYRGISTDSYAVTVGSAGVFTGAATHRGGVLFFKEDVIHQIYGYRPSNYEATDVHARGVRQGSAGSLCAVAETLLYQSAGDVCAFTASMPQSVGGALGLEAYRDGVAGASGDRYYLSTWDACGDWHLFVFDTGRGIWCREDATQAIGFARMDGTLYCLGADGWMFTVDGTLGPYAAADAHVERRVDWLAETGDIGMQSPDRKYVTKVQLQLDVDEGALVRVLVRYNHEGDYAEALRINPARRRAVTVPLIPRRCDTMRIRLAGHGGFRLHGITKTVEGGSEL